MSGSYNDWRYPYHAMLSSLRFISIEVMGLGSAGGLKPPEIVTDSLLVTTKIPSMLKLHAGARTMSTSAVGAAFSLAIAICEKHDKSKNLIRSIGPLMDFLDTLRLVLDELHRDASSRAAQQVAGRSCIPIWVH